MSSKAESFSWDSLFKTVKFPLLHPYTHESEKYWPGNGFKCYLRRIYQSQFSFFTIQDAYNFVGKKDIKNIFEEYQEGFTDDFNSG
jgi:hypothetical protein